MAKGDYVAALEPGNCYGEGIEERLKAGTTEILAPQGRKSIKLVFDLLRGKELKAFLQSVREK